VFGEGVEENIPAPGRSCVELWWGGAGLGAGVEATLDDSSRDRSREGGGEKGKALLEGVVSSGCLSPTANAVSAFL
jgi:hypothetical protein